MDALDTPFDKTDRPFFFDKRWPVLYVDNHLLAVYKPSGLLVQGDRTGDVCLLDLAKRWIKERYDKPGNVFLAMVHRLDRPVAGVVLFARTSKAAGRLARQFRERRVDKRYLAVVQGAVAQESQRCIDHIERQGRKSRVVLAPTTNSQEARLSYTRLDTADDTSLLEVTLETGRRHQIRIQLSRMGHPILGDLRYGAGKPLPGKQVALLARSLSVEHPTRKTRLDLVCPIPQKWPWPEADEAQSERPPWYWQMMDGQAIDPSKP
jgi:23S rRNA pseudouridine1911/1915/1917 synthase